MICKEKRVNGTFKYLNVERNNQATDKESPEISEKIAERAGKMFEKALCLDKPEFSSEFTPIPDPPHMAFTSKLVDDFARISQTIPEASDKFAETEVNNSPFPLKDQSYKRNLFLTPSKTSNYSYIPESTPNSKKSLKNPLIIPEDDKDFLDSKPDSLEKEYTSSNMESMYKHILKNVKKSISRQIFEIAKQSKQSAPHHCKHKPKKHHEQKSQKDRSDAATSPINLSHDGFSIKSPNLSIQLPFSNQNSRNSLSEKEILQFRGETERQSMLCNSPVSPILSEKDRINIIIKYACLPPRPILIKEAKSTIVTTLKQTSQEYLSISTYFLEFNFKVNLICKTYNLSLHKGKTFKNFMFYYGEDEELREIAYSDQGFDMREVVMHKKIVKDFSYVLLCLCNVKDLRQVHPNTYQSFSKNGVVPAYLVSFSN